MFTWIILTLSLFLESGVDHPSEPSTDRPQIDVHHVSTDGTISSLTSFPQATAGSVLSLRDGRLMVAYQWFPEDIPMDFARIAVRFSDDGGRTWSEPSPTQMQGMTVGTRPAFDPALVQAPDGSMQMFFSLMKGERYSREQPAIGSARSRDGVIWRYQRGDRLVLEHQPAYQSAATWSGTEWILIVPSPEGVGGVLATSRDGLVFRVESSLPELAPGQQWRGSVLRDGTGLRFFGTLSDGHPETIWSARMAEDGTWTNGERWTIPGQDPGVAALPDGSLIIVTSASRPDHPAAAPVTIPKIVHDAPDDIDRHLDKLVAAATTLDYPGFADLFAPAATAVLSTPRAVHRLESGDHIASTFKPALVENASWPPLPKSPGRIRIQRQGPLAIATFETRHPDDHVGWWSVVMKRQDERWSIHHVHATISPTGPSSAAPVESER